MSAAPAFSKGSITNSDDIRYQNSVGSANKVLRILQKHGQGKL